MMNNTDDLLNEIIKEELKDLLHVLGILSKNITRCLKLLRYSAKLHEHADNIQEFENYIYDVVRAGIVFLHSSLETNLRGIVRLILRDGADLSYITLVGQSNLRNRKEKFSLEDLAKHKGRSVNDVINDSIDEYLSSLSFNSTDDLAATFARFDFPQSTLRKHYPTLDEMISRRHQIVHEGDLKRIPQSTELEPVQVEKMKVWIDATAEFCTEVVRLTFKRLYVEKIERRLRAMGIDLSREKIEKSVSFEIKDVYR